MLDPRAMPTRPEQVCPMCGVRLAADALVCGTCGTDLARAAVLFSSSVRPVSRGGSRTRAVVARAVGILVLALAVVLALVALGNVPAVGARVPALRTVVAPAEDILQQAWLWGHDLVARGRKAAGVSPAPPRPAAPAPPGQIQGSAASSLIIGSTPAGAEVHLNAVRVGTTPLTLMNVRPGIYRVQIGRAGFATVSRVVQVEEGKGLTLTVRLRAAEASTPTPAVPPPPARAVGPKSPEIGTRAPGFVLKDRLGVLHSLNDLRGRRVAVLFVWALDAQARQAIKNLNAGVRAAETGYDALVVVVQPDRVAVRNFVSSERIAVPVLFGDEKVAALYGVPRGGQAFFMISERGLIVQR